MHQTQHGVVFHLVVVSPNSYPYYPEVNTGIGLWFVSGGGDFGCYYSLMVFVGSYRLGCGKPPRKLMLTLTRR